MRKFCLASLFLFFFGTNQALAVTEFPVPNKTVPFTEDGIVYTYQVEYFSNTSTFYVIYCDTPYGVEYKGLARTYQSGDKIYPYRSGCKQYKHNGSSWVEAYDGYYFTYLDPSMCLEDVIRTNSDLYWNQNEYSRNFYGMYCGITTVVPEQKLLSANWNFTTNEPLIVTPISFPLIGYTPYTASVSSVMDHSGTVPYSDSDHQVVAFNGETSDEGSPYSGSTCYGKSDNSAFGSGFNYVGTSATGGSYYLCYNGHPGYDYPATLGTDIHAPANGTLCVATSTTQQPQPPDVWRDTGHCPLSTADAGSTTWSGYHTFYIIHEDLYINGSTNDYMTVFLHSNDLESTVRADVEQYGYAQVTASQHIAEVGDIGAPNAYHVHFEVYKKNGENWDRVDPYGDGTNNILWEQN